MPVDWRDPNDLIIDKEGNAVHVAASVLATQLPETAAEAATRAKSVVDAELSAHEVFFSPDRRAVAVMRLGITPSNEWWLP